MSRRLLMMCLSLLSLGGLVHCSKSSQEGAQPAPAATPGATPAAAAVKTTALTAAQEQQASWIRNFNPLIAPGTARFPTRAGVYEPLMIFNTLKGEFVPWLAEKHEWSADNKKLTLTLRPGVKWSDGQPFTAKDVAFTFELLKKHKALDFSAVWGFVEGVQAKDDTTVEFTLSRSYVPGLIYIVHQPIVPEHKWKDVADPVIYKNETPVGTGPFTEVKVFQNQIFELGRNPNYWQKGKPAVESIRFPAYPGNDQANLALLTGELDWAGSFVPDIERVYVSKDKENNHFWFPLVGNTTMLYVNTTKKPFNDVRVRKAISMAIDRDQIVKVAMYGYTRPADATALSDAHNRWRNAKALEEGDWTKLDLAKANALLDEAGFKKGEDGMRVGADKKPLSFDVNVVTGWSDWVRAAQIITQNLKQVGFNATLKTYDFSPYFERIQKGEFDLSMGWSSEEPTPYHFYRDLMSSETIRPVGEIAARNWHRYGNKEADALLRAFEGTNDEAEQRKLADQMQVIFVQNAPSIPLFPGPSWGEYNTSRFTNFPNKDNPYAKLTPNSSPENLFVLVEVKPK
ncbi:ABC transporter substrate-binding protein [Stigmatella aurantiaca]|uniref:ABC-type dipeptide transport system, periplasmic component n=1 Tax=Stigmatella aurantiaca (strain DW4/3-1) TaxID=378806 RepID=Q08QJ7_STIAD|nr:ABC transporter substrate-binding protein [Stigmatella aurantiaca]ADO73148.1 ABC-type dipeptide transport system, periplasmic component [Stigmatella aurantiaca DW4/3-1]EAU62754.1 ABC-type dipeptide transport system, periplasmic component [Stigmatella aurantiaca DW4/3-1]